MRSGTENGKNMLKGLFSSLLGDESRIMRVSAGSEEVVRFPVVLAVFMLLVFDIPSWVIGSLLLILIIFDMDIDISKTVRKDPIRKATVKAAEYKRKQTDPDQKITVDRDGFNEIIIR